MQSHTQPSAHVCTPTARRAARPVSTGKPKTRAPKLLFPDLPKAKERTDAEFWRAAFLRDLYMLQIARSLLSKSYGMPIAKISTDRDATTLYLGSSCSHQYAELRTSFNTWVATMGGLASAATATEGGAA